MTLQTVVKRIEDGNLSPDEISELRNFCGVWMFRYNEEYGQLTSKAALWQTGKRNDFKSQSECERAWEATEDGQTQIKLKYLIRGIEHLQDSLATNWFLLNREWKETRS